MKIFYAQVFWKYGFNTTDYYAEEQLKDERILYYTILD
jgi:hypothetical protein